MDTEEAYLALGLDCRASDAELKASWRKLVARWHPDRNPAADAVQRMQAINKAYQHIRLVREGKLAEVAAPPPPASAPSASQAHTQRPLCVRKMRLSLEDACLGCIRTVRGQFSQTCPSCTGTGQRVLASACPTRCSRWTTRACCAVRCRSTVMPG